MSVVSGGRRALPHCRQESRPERRFGKSDGTRREAACASLMSSNSATERGIDLRTSDDSDSDVSRRPILTYLGPAGTYSHQVYHTPKFTGHALKPSLITGCTR